MTARTVLAAIAGAAVGSLVTVLLMPTAAQRPSVAEGPRAASSPRTAAPLKDPVVAPPAAAASTGKPALAAVIETVQIDVPRAGTGVLTGRVTSKDGAPVAGVTVHAWTRWSGKPRQAPLSTTAPASRAESAVVNAIAYAKWSEATDREAETDASGAYRISGILDAEYSLNASAKGWSIRVAQDSDASNVRPGAVVDFVAAAVVDVPVTIVSAGDPLPEQVLVRWAEPKRGGGSSQWWRATEPVIHIPPGTWSLTAEAGKDRVSPPARVSLAPGEEPAAVTLRLETRNVITGAIRFDPRDGTWDYVHVKARRRDDGSVEEKSAGARPPSWTYRFADLAPGEYDVSVSLDSVTTLATTVVRFTGGLLRQDIDVPKLKPGQVLTVRVTGPDGAPVPEDDVEFGIEERSANSSSSSGANGARQPDGSFRIPLREASFPGGGAHRYVRVKSKRYGIKETEFDATAGTVDVRFVESATLQPTIVGADDPALASRLRVTLAKPDAVGPALFARTDDSASVPVAAGDYVVLVWLTGSSPLDARVVSRIPVTLHAGANPLPVRVPELHTLTVRVPGADKGTLVYLSNARRPYGDLRGKPVALSDAGAAAFGDLPAGLYLVQITLGGEQREMLARVPASSEVAFAPTAIAGLEVTVERPGGALAAAGFQTGDLILAMDGTQIDTMTRADALRYGARGRERMSVDVLRGGSRVALNVDPSKFGPNSDFGGFWEPVLR